jgi:WD40 repeat protein
VFTEKTIMELFDDEISVPTDQDSGLLRKKSICSVTKMIGLNQNTYVVGTADGWVYSCLYENPTKYKYTTRTKAHFGIIKSLEKSPYSWDVFLTTGDDFTIKIWVGDFFTEPVITLLADTPIEKAIWSRTNSTIIVSVNGKV